MVGGWVALLCNENKMEQYSTNIVNILLLMPVCFQKMFKESW